MKQKFRNTAGSEVDQVEGTRFVIECYEQCFFSSVKIPCFWFACDVIKNQQSFRAELFKARLR